MAFPFFKDKAAIARQEAAERAKARPVRPPAADPTASRAAERPQDRTLMAHTLTWRDNLPGKLRPSHLLELYPRVANRLALCWGDKVLRDRLFEDLLVDHRGGRKGFPAAVRAEILALRMACPRGSIVETSRTPHWDIHSQATSDR